MYIKDMYLDDDIEIIKKERKCYIGALLSVILIVIFIINSLSGIKINNINCRNNYIIEVRGLTLKYNLISTASEVYDINIRTKENQDIYYKSFGEDAYNHYKWIRRIYKDMSYDMKKYLSILYKYSSNEKNLIYLLSNINDEEGIDNIISEIESSTMSKELKEAAKEFYPYFYERYLKDYLISNENKYNESILEFNTRFQQEKYDIFGFIEECSGISYNKKYKPILYYVMRPGHAWGFINNNVYICLFPYVKKDYDEILYILYHEYSHGIFKNITNTKEFKDITENLKKDSDLYDTWSDYYNNYYTWEEWCEDNLVEGFAMYLYYKSKGEIAKKRKSIRPYDKEYFNYLVKNDFNPKNITLHEITIKFLKELSS